MKSALFLCMIAASANVLAQQAPAAPQEPRYLTQQAPAVSTGNTQQVPKVPENRRPRPSIAPPMVAPAQAGNVEHTEELLRAQTAAIKSLAGKLDSLEERIGRMESRQP